MVTAGLRWLPLAFCLLCAFANAQEIKLEHGKPIEREIAIGQTHDYHITLTSGQFMRVVVEQQGIDVAVALMASDGKQILDANLSGGAFGQESLSYEASVDSDYRIVVRTVTALPLKGNYQLTLEMKASATVEDKKRITAERLLSEALKSNQQGAAGFDKTVEKAQQALSLWRELGDKYWEASTLNIIGIAHMSSAKYEKAIEYYNQAIEIRREVKDRAGEGNTLNNLALTNRLLNRPEKSNEYYEQSLAIKRKLKDSVGESGALANLGLGYYNLSQFERSIEYYTQSLAVRRAIKDRTGEGNGLFNIGNVYRTVGRFEKAIEYLEQALAIAREVKDRVGESSALNNLGGANFGLSRYEKANTYFEQALAIAREVKDRRGEGNALANLGAVSYAASHYEKAITYLEQARIIKHEMKDRGEAMLLSNLGISYQALGQSEKALEFHQQSIALNREIKNHASEAQALSNLGNVYKDIGQPEKALECYEQSLTIVRDIKDRATEVAVLNNLGAASADLGSHEKAIEYYKQSLAVSREVADRKGQGEALSNLGSSYNMLGRPEEAIGYYQQALEIAREVKNQLGEGLALNGLGYASRLLAHYDQAIGYLEQALAIKREIKNRQGEADPLTNLGAVYMALGRYDKAVESFQEALAIRREVKDRSGEVLTLYEFAKVERSHGNLPQASALVEQSLQIAEKSRAEIYSTRSRASYFALVQEYYRFCIDLLMQQHRAGSAQGLDALAVEVNERARSRGLLDLLTESRVNVHEGVDAALLNRERSLARQLNDKAQRLNQATSPEQIVKLEQEISQLESDYERAQADIRKASPHYAALVQPQPLKLKEIQAQLDADTLLLEYSLGEDRSYLWAITSDSLKSYELPKAVQIQQTARQVYELVTTRSANKAGESTAQRQQRIAQADATLRVVAQELSQIILKPVAGELGNKRLVIVADGALQYIPFAMLPDPVVSGHVSVVGKNQPLMVGHEIVSLRSASTLAILRSEIAARQPAPKTLGVIADPVFDRSDERLKSVPTNATPQTEKLSSDDARSIEHLAAQSDGKSVTTLRLVIPRLPFTRLEGTKLLSLTSKESSFGAMDFQASRTTVLSGELSKYRYVHFATHGLLDTENPELSALVLSMIDADGKSQDGFLRANDIYNLKLPADLVVLSACQTGLGKEIKGEGLVGLTRGFMYAGAARVVVSLWNVNDKATAELMTRFYEKMLKQGERPAAALRAAQVEMWKQKQWQSPYYWAGFTMQGEWR